MARDTSAGNLVLCLVLAIRWWLNICCPPLHEALRGKGSFQPDGVEMRMDSLFCFLFSLFFSFTPPDSIFNSILPVNAAFSFLSPSLLAPCHTDAIEISDLLCFSLFFFPLPWTMPILALLPVCQLMFPPRHVPCKDPVLLCRLSKAVHSPICNVQRRLIGPALRSRRLSSLTTVVT